MLNLEDDAPARRIAYLGAFLLIFVPLTQALAQMFPLQLGNIQWRFLAGSTLSGILLLPFLGFALMGLIARATDAPGTAKVVGILAMLFSLVLAASLVVYVLDALQLKTIVQSREMQRFQAGAVRSALVTTLFSVLFAVLALTLLRNPSGPSSVPRNARRKAEPDQNVGLLIGQEMAKAD